MNIPRVEPVFVATCLLDPVRNNLRSFNRSAATETNGHLQGLLEGSCSTPLPRCPLPEKCLVLFGTSIAQRLPYMYLDGSYTVDRLRRGRTRRPVPLVSTLHTTDVTLEKAKRNICCCTIPSHPIQSTPASVVQVILLLDFLAWPQTQLVAAHMLALLIPTTYNLRRCLQSPFIDRNDMSG